jgi:general stress protein 26
MLWFLAAAGTQIVNAVAAGQKTAMYLLADNTQGLFAQVTASLAVSNDPARLTQMWTPIAGAWFGGGIDAPNLQLLSFTLSGGGR